MMTDKKNPPTITKPSSIKTRFAVKFLRAMKKLNNNHRPYSYSSRSMSERQKRYHAIRAASHASMASAVGSRRAWSRAVLMKIRNRKQLTYYSRMMNKRRRNRCRAIRRNNGIFLMRGNPSDDHRQEDDGLDRFGGEEEDDLRELVPGGEGMDFCRLLNETAHYIKCLRAQVQVMTNILDRSNSS